MIVRIRGGYLVKHHPTKPIKPATIRHLDKHLDSERRDDKRKPR